MHHFYSSCKGTFHSSEMLRYFMLIIRVCCSTCMCTVMGWFSFVLLAVMLTTLISLFGMSLHFWSPQITRCASFKSRPVPFISSEMTEMFFLVLLFCHLCHIVHYLFPLTSSFSFVCPCSSARLQTVAGEFPSLFFIQLIEECSLQWCTVMRGYVENCLAMFGSMENFLSSVLIYLERVWVTGFELMGWTFIS